MRNMMHKLFQLLQGFFLYMQLHDFLIFPYNDLVIQEGEWNGTDQSL